MVAAGNIPKPTFWTFCFFKQLKLFGSECVFRDKEAVIVKNEKGYAGILWNIDEDEYTKEITIHTADKREYTLITKTVDEVCCNPLKIWHDMGEPAYPSSEETALINSSAQPLTESDIINTEEGKAVLNIRLRKNAVVYFTLTKRNHTPDRGYDYDKVLSFH